MNLVFSKNPVRKLLIRCFRLFFGISDIDKGPALAALVIVAVLTALGIVMILVKKEEKAR